MDALLARLRGAVLEIGIEFHRAERGGVGQTEVTGGGLGNGDGTVVDRAGQRGASFLHHRNGFPFQMRETGDRAVDRAGREGNMTIEIAVFLGGLIIDVFSPEERKSLHGALGGGGVTGVGEDTVRQVGNRRGVAAVDHDNSGCGWCDRCISNCQRLADQAADGEGVSAWVGQNNIGFRG